MKKIILSLTIVYSLIMMTACPSRSGLEKAFHESARVASLAETAAVTTGEFYSSGLLNLTTKDRIADALALVVKNGKSFHKVLAGLKAQYGDNLTAIPKAELANLDLIFSTQVITPFLEILSNIGVLPPAIAQKLVVAFSILKTAILTISGVFGGGSASYQFYLDHREANSYATA